MALPGLEDLVAQEVKEWFSELTPEVQHGGVRVLAPLPQGLAMNLVLKTPTRNLMRVAQFTCRDFPKLFQKVSHFTWADFLSPKCTLTVKAASARSRLKIKSRIEETCLDGWRAFQKRAKCKPDPELQASLYVRLADNLCTLSLDTSGERLHKRGQRVFVGEAPLRETIAAALLMNLQRFSHASTVELIDPMVGSGTFLLEAAERDRTISTRDFGYEAWTGAPEISAPALTAVRPLFKKLTGFERDPKTLKSAQQNLKIHRDSVELHEREFGAQAWPPADCERWLIANPPYGERLPIEGPPSAFYSDLLLQLEKVFKPNLACLILPAKVGRLNLPLRWKVAEKRPFSNGGLPVIAFTFQCARE